MRMINNNTTFYPKKHTSYEMRARQLFNKIMKRKRRRKTITNAKKNTREQHIYII
jgi:hypothetical protein